MNRFRSIQSTVSIGKVRKILIRMSQPKDGSGGRLRSVDASNNPAVYRLALDKSALVFVQPATVISWHRRGFAWSCRPQVGADVRRLTRAMARANPLWGAPRIHGELLKLGFDVSERTISRLMPRRRRSPSQTWRTFLRNHLGSTVAIDFFAVPEW